MVSNQFQSRQKKSLNVDIAQSLQLVPGDSLYRVGIHRLACVGEKGMPQIAQHNIDAKIFGQPLDSMGDAGADPGFPVFGLEHQWLRCWNATASIPKGFDRLGPERRVTVNVSFRPAIISDESRVEVDLVPGEPATVGCAI